MSRLMAASIPIRTARHPCSSVFLPLEATCNRSTSRRANAGVALVLPDGRALLYAVAGFKKRFQIVQPDGTLSPLVESNEECGLPAALAGREHVAVLTD